jgi:nitrogen fixation NifU-like protein
MTTQFGNLYQQVVLEYFKKQDYVGILDKANTQKSGENRMCGDSIEISAYINVKVDQLRFKANGCALIKASAALMAEAIDGLSWEEAKTLYIRFMDQLESDDKDPGLGRLSIFAGVKQYPSRLQCVRLPWDTLFKETT